MKTITVKEKEYKLNLRMSDVIAMEKELGSNPLDMFMDAAKVDQKNPDRMPFKFADILIVIKYALRQYHHGMKDDAVCNLIDDYIEENEHGFSELTQIAMELLTRFF